MKRKKLPGVPIDLKRLSACANDGRFRCNGTDIDYPLPPATIKSVRLLSHKLSSLSTHSLYNTTFQPLVYIFVRHEKGTEFHPLQVINVAKSTRLRPTNLPSPEAYFAELDDITFSAEDKEVAQCNRENCHELTFSALGVCDVHVVHEIRKQGSRRPEFANSTLTFGLTRLPGDLSSNPKNIAGDIPDHYDGHSYWLGERIISTIDANPHVIKQMSAKRQKVIEDIIANDRSLGAEYLRKSRNLRGIFTNEETKNIKEKQERRDQLIDEVRSAALSNKSSFVNKFK